MATLAFAVVLLLWDAGAPFEAYLAVLGILLGVWACWSAVTK